jgi:hypothetical protein
MGLRCDIYRGPRGDQSNHGLSSYVAMVTITNVEGRDLPEAAAPAVQLVRGGAVGSAIVVAEDAGPLFVGPMAGGCFIASADSRFTAAVERLTGCPFYGAVALHDRFEFRERGQ